MSDLNQCTFTGRLGRDPETRTSPNGDQVCNVSIAVGSAWKDKNGEKQERTEWVPLVFTGKVAEIAAQYLSKGSQVAVTGEFRTRKWQDKAGQDRYSTEIRVERMTMLGKSPDSAPAPRAPAAAPAPRQSSGGYSDEDSEIPFAPLASGRSFLAV